MKKLMLICAPVTSRSGYGDHARDLVTSFIEHDKYDIKIMDVRWGECPRNALNEDNEDNKKIKNAWCMPGGKIAVYTGILDITKNTNGLAAVMGHEIAHAVAKHSVERASRNVATNVVLQVTDILSGGKLSTVNRTTGMDTVGLLSQIGIMNPFNRKQESEADYLGLIF